ncbi:hypothetical protein [Roseateles sp. LYH14W]|uniref:L,D-transpeptidase n=1 Tax=Pelomonas parva TaxID=3299032 RepID=A0ABW7F7Q7_9BURK
MRFGEHQDIDAAESARRDVLSGLGQGVLLAAIALGVLYFIYGDRHRAPSLSGPVAAAPAPRPAPVIERRLDLGAERAPADVTQVAAWAVRAADNGDRPFAIVDKRRANLYVFAASGRLMGASPVLLGYAAGDHTVAGVGSKAIEDIKPHERTTPAGRFAAEPGRNTLGDDVVWVDYDAAVSMHRVRATNPAERRLERLATPTAKDNRISWGCINVPVAFFDATVWPHIGRQRGIVYVLPEQQSLTAFFPAAGAPRLLAQTSTPKGNDAKP